MSRENISKYLSKGAVAIYRTIVLGTCAFFIWLQTNFVPAKEFLTYKSTQERLWAQHDALRDETLQRLLIDIDATRRAVGRIEEILLRRADNNQAVGRRP